MPIYKGLIKIGAIYKGTTPIARVYKGTKLIFSAFTWENYLYLNLFNGLIPETVNSKSVKGKARISEIYGNSVVWNQLVKNGNFEDANNWNLLASVSNNVGTTQSIVSYGTFGQGYTFTVGHQYLMLGKVKTAESRTVRFGTQRSGALGTTTSYSLVANVWTQMITFFTAISGDNTFALFNYQSGSAVYNVKEFMCFDLTQMFPFDTPTSLDDTRVQALLNSGYIPYNAGEIKSVDIGEFSSKDSNDTDLDTLSFKYQGNGVNTAKDTMEITNTEYVFTKKNALLSPYSMNITYDSSSNYFASADLVGKIKAPTTPNDIVNGIIAGLTTMSYSDWTSAGQPDNVFYCSTAGYLRFKATVYNGSVSDFKNAMIKNNLYYELATPQVITIPRKRLGIVDLGSLNWAYASGSKFFYADTSALNMKGADANKIANLYCSLYITKSKENTEPATITDNSISATNSTTTNPNRLSVKNVSYTDATDFKNAMAGQYLFYETAEEVTDIDTQIQVEPGGSLTSDSIVLPDVMFDFKCR